MKLQCSNSILQEEYRSSRDSFQPSKAKAQVPAMQRKLVLPVLKYYRMLIRNITDLIGASLALFLGLILKALFPHLLRRLTGERL